MAATILKLRLFLGSYAILFAILAIRFTSRNLSWVCAGLALAGIIDNWRITRKISQRGAFGYKVEEVRDHGAEVAGYLATYLLPFVTTPQPSTRDLIGYGLFLGVTCLVFVRSEMVQINPVMYLFRRRVVRIRTSDGQWIYLITKAAPEVGDAIDAIPLRGNLVMVAVEGGAGDTDN